MARERAIRRAAARERAWLGRKAIATGSAVALGAAGLVVLGAPPAAAATLVVDDLGDAGPGTLRAALAASVDGDVITFDPDLFLGFGPFSIDVSTPLMIGTSVRIEGPGLVGLGSDLLTIDGGSSTRVFEVDDDTVAVKDIVVEGLEISNGSVAGADGGCILSYESLTIASSRVTGCTTDSFGGGVWSRGPLTIDHSTMTGNEAGSGSAVAVDDGSTLTMTASYVYSNTAAPSGGTVYLYGDADVQGSVIAGNTGVGISVSGSIDIRDTIVIDSSEEGIVTGEGGTVVRSTVTGNGASGIVGISASPYTLTLVSTIADDNANEDLVISLGWTADVSYSLVNDPGASGVVGGVDGNIVGQPAELGPLADNGGGLPSMEPLVTSPAVDAGFPGGATLDGRGFTRVAGLQADMGATERDGEPTFEVTNTAMLGVGSLLQAVADADAVLGPETLTFASGITGTIRPVERVRIDDDLTIIGPGADDLTVSGSGVHRVFEVTGAAVDISGLTLERGFTSGGGGGAIASLPSSDVTITDSVIRDSSAGFQGGAAYVDTSSLTIVNTTVTGNESNVGGAIGLIEATLVVTNSTISGNSSTSDGGAVYGSLSDATITGSTVTGNTSGAFGTLTFNRGTVEIADSTIVGNTQPLAAVYAYSFGGTPITITLDHTIVANNGGDDTFADTDSSFAASWSLVEDVGSSGITTAGDNVVGTDPDLGAFADNGGATSTFLPSDSSPAVNAGDAAIVGAPALDQRGATRIQGSRIDIGSVETSVVPIGGGGGGGGGTRRPDRTVRFDGRGRATVPTPDGPVTVRLDDRVSGAWLEVRRIASDGIDGRGLRLGARAYDVVVSGGVGGGSGSGALCLPYTRADLALAGGDVFELRIFHIADDGSREILEITSVDTESMELCDEVDAFSVFVVGVLGTIRLAGVDAAGTAAAIATATFEPGVPVVYVVARDRVADAAAAGAAGGPVLLVNRDSVPGVTTDALATLKPGRVVVVGGSGVVSDDLVAQLGATRVAGTDRYATAALLAREVFEPDVPVVYVANGTSVPDSLVAASAASSGGGAVLLVQRDAVPAVTAAAGASSPERVVVIGGTAAVSETVVVQLGATRVAGADRYTTAAALAVEIGGDVIVARGDNPIDGLAGATMGRALVLVERDAVPEPAAAALAAVEPASIAVLGGTAAVSEQTELDLAAYLPSGD